MSNKIGLHSLLLAGVAAIGSSFGEDDVAGGMSARLQAAREHG